MKKILIALGVMLIYTAAHASESTLFKDKESFVLAKSVKLISVMEDQMGVIKGLHDGLDKEAYECADNTSCAGGEICVSNKCVPACTNHTCAYPTNRCKEGTNHNYTCVQCTIDDHCGASQKCSGNRCVDVCDGNPCASQGKACKAGTNHNYTCEGCVSDTACTANQTCDTTTKKCVDVCPSLCPNQFCTPAGNHLATCSGCTSDEGCAEGEKCKENQCVPDNCEGALLASRSDVATVTDAATLTTALSSGKNIIAIMADTSTSTPLSLGSKKLVGPQYFSDIPICTTTATPKLTFTNSSDAITMSSGEINQMNIVHTVDSTSASTVVGTGTMKNSTITAKKVLALIKPGSSFTLEGTNTLTSNDVSSNIIKQDASGTLNINGALTMNGQSTYGIQMGSSGKMTIASSGSLTSNVTGGFIGIDIDNYAVFTANGPVKFMQPFSSTIGYIATGNSKVTFNASNNHIKTTYSGFMTTAGDITINGSTTIECVRKDNNSCKAFSVHEVYSSSVNSLTINAPVTITGLTKPDGDEILYMVGGKINLKNTITSNTGYGKILLNAEEGSFSASGAILGGTNFQRTIWNAATSKLSIASGARLKVGGVCKKATSASTLGKVDSVTSPPAPFTGGC